MPRLFDPVVVVVWIPIGGRSNGDRNGLEIDKESVGNGCCAQSKTSWNDLSFNNIRMLLDFLEFCVDGSFKGGLWG